jgi:hypothetical protein
MTDQTQPLSGTVAEEAARLIETLASMARSSVGPGPDPSPDSSASSNESSSPYAGGPAQGPAATAASEATRGPNDRDAPSDGICSVCGRGAAATPVACKLCPLCQGIALLRSVRPETVDRLADFALAVAASLRDVAAQARAAGRASAAGPAPRSPRDGGRATVQDIHVDDEDEG